MIEVKKISSFDKGELEELTSATMDAIQEGIGFGWIKKPAKSKVIDYSKGVMLVPNRWLFVGKYKGVISGSVQVVTLSSTNEAAIFQVRNNKTEIDADELYKAYEKVTIGLHSNVQVSDPNIVDLVSNHEIGHALMASIFPEFFDVRKVTINENKSGMGGYTLFTPKERYMKYATK